MAKYIQFSEPHNHRSEIHAFHGGQSTTSSANRVRMRAVAGGDFPARTSLAARTGYGEKN